MQGYAPFIAALSHLVTNERNAVDFDDRAEHAVNGEASAQLIELVSSYRLKRSGAFFTSSELSRRAAAPLAVAEPALIVDPACGAGNLLLATARKLPVARTLSATLTSWGRQLAGFDLHKRFIEAAQLRLALLALVRGAEFDLRDLADLAAFFPNIRQGDGLREITRLRGITNLIVNPPFATVVAPTSCGWAKGRVTKAALFFDRCLQQLPPNATVSAVLPDVLRSGSRYLAWRQAMEQMGEVRSIKSVGNFETADVDVFLLEMRTPAHPKKSRRGLWWTPSDATANVGSRFAVHVGAVVPHRLKKNEGPVSPFLHAKALPHWGMFNAGSESVAFAGRRFQPPFVAIRRTSSPTDKHRALGTIITGTQPVAVENHLIVCSPVAGGLAECRRLLATLRADRTNTFLNRRIRCRHLTVGVVREIPL